MRRLIRLSPILLSLILVGCAGNAPPSTTPTVNTVAQYGVTITENTEKLQQDVAASALPDDSKAKAMVGFREAGAVEERLGHALKLYDEAVKSGQPPPSEGDGRIDNIISIAEHAYALVKGALPAGAAQFADTLRLIDDAVNAIKKALGR